MPGADQHFWVKKKKEKHPTQQPKFPFGPRRSRLAPNLVQRRFPRRLREPGDALLLLGFGFADRALIQLERLLIKKKNRYSSLINATLNYNTMMSAVLIKYWLGYKKTPCCSKSRYGRVCAHLGFGVLRFGKGRGRTPTGGERGRGAKRAEPRPRRRRLPGKPSSATVLLSYSVSEDDKPELILSQPLGTVFISKKRKTTRSRWDHYT